MVAGLGPHVGRMRLNKDDVERYNLEMVAGAAFVCMWMSKLADKMCGENMNKEKVILSVSYSSNVCTYHVPRISLTQGVGHLECFRKDPIPREHRTRGQGVQSVFSKN